MGPRRAQVIVLANQKGGVGKTTTAVSLAAGLALEGHSTCLVDLDSQCNATGTFGIISDELKEQGKFTVLDAFVTTKPASQIEIAFGDRFGGKLTLIPGHPRLHQVQARLDADRSKQVMDEGMSPLDEDDMRQEQRLRLKKSLASIVRTHEFVVIDTPPRLGYELTAALLAADSYIIPVFPSRYDVDGLASLTANVTKIRKRANPNIRLLGVVLSRYNPNTNLHRQVREQFRAKFGEKFFDTVIHASVRHEEATFRKETIYEYASGQRDAKDAAEQFESLTREVLSALQPAQETRPAAAIEVLPQTDEVVQPLGVTVNE